MDLVSDNKKCLLLIVCSFIIFAMISVIVLFHTGILYGTTDMQFYVKRILELKMSILHHNYFPNYAFNLFHGSSVMSMYPFLNLYPFVWILFLTHSFIYAYYYFTILTIFLSLIISFFSSLKFSKSLIVSYLFAISYSMSSVFIIGFFSTGDLGLTTSLSFLPLVIFGFINIIKGYNNYLMMSLGILLMALCQLSSIVICIGFIMFWLIINLKYINKDIFINFVKSLMLSVFLTSVVWIPILNIVINKNVDNSVNPVQLIGFNIKNFIKIISIFSLLAIILCLFVFKTFNRIYKQMYILSIVVIILSSKIFPWVFLTSKGPLHFLNQFQFTFRFLIIPQILLCYLFAFSFVRIFSNFKYFKCLFSILFISIFLMQLFSQFYIIHRDRQYPCLNSYNDTRVVHLKYYKILKDSDIRYLAYGYYSSSDYYPKASNKYIKYVNNNIGKYNNKPFKLYSAGYNKFSYYVKNKNFNKNNNSNIILPFVGYRGENLLLIHNNKIIRYHITKQGLISIISTHSGTNTLTIRNLNNRKFNISEMLLLLIGILWIILYFLKFNRFVRINY